LVKLFFLYMYFHPGHGSNRIFSTGSTTRVKTGSSGWKKNPGPSGLTRMSQKRVEALIAYAICYMLYAICYMLYAICYLLYAYAICYIASFW